MSSSQSNPSGFQSMDLRRSIRDQTQVSITLATHLLTKESPNSNIVFSPLSIHVVLSSMAAGSKGKTLDQLLGFLKAKTTDDLNTLTSRLVSLIFAYGSLSGGPRLSFANGVWFDKTLSVKPSFEQVLDSVYKASSNQVDFQNKAVEVASEVNLWADKETNGLIKQVLPASAIDNLTRLIFANALYFKGSWSKKFHKSKTKEFHFHLLDGNKVKVPFMTSNKDQFVREYDDFKSSFATEDERQFTMYIYLPNAKYGLKPLVEKISSTTDFFYHHIPHQKVKIGQFLIPKFKISFGFEASGMLKELGLVLPFNDGDGLTEMVESSDGESVYVSSIHHRSFVEVNEEGTEAAAVSVLDMKIGSKRVRPIVKEIDFVADHPFLFIIKEDVTGVVFFMGQVIDPHAGSNDLNEEPPVEYSYGTIDLNVESNADVGFDSQASYVLVYDDSKQSNPDEGYEEKPAASNVN
ncbi:hypothetical protein R6Q57_022993 [Mikania cordata]